jgi:UDP-glucose:glycoprotein glucosyltransferase
LYERLQRIMIVSLLGHAKSPVKFWLLENFVSPQFRSQLSSFAAKWKFEYEFVSYKWPLWMKQETQRERTLWGYKILFLDVLFPADLRRVIYLDSDDVVRADYTELMQLDLEGAVYGFTPFCEDRPEMEEFRFWTDGYWRDLLDGKKYHISALFVLDLVRFRQRETGDFIRKAYQDLYSDTLSLANLDQDLPNLLQSHGVPIFSLPQDWLGCGTWCSDEAMKRVKTVDMCNNPKTKVGKLEVARTTIEGWVELDAEANPPTPTEDL